MPFHICHPSSNKWAMQTLDELLLQVRKKEATMTDPDAVERKKYDDLVEIVPTVALKREHSGPSVDNIPGNYFVTPACSTEASATKPTITTTANDENVGDPQEIPAWGRDSRLDFQHLTVEMLSWQNNVHRLLLPPQQELYEAGYKHAWLFYPPIVNAPLMLQHMLDQIQEMQTSADHVDVEAGPEFESIEHMCETAKEMGCSSVINCTGLGAARLCQDRELVGARGVLIQYERNSAVRRAAVRENSNGVHIHDAAILTEEQPWGSETEPCYLIPRGDTIVVGGSYLEGDNHPHLREEERKRLVNNANLLGIDVENAQVIGEWTGFRPFRTKVRCEVDEEASANNGIRLVHNYGYGGSGWTVYAGASKEAVDILLEKQPMNSNTPLD